VIEDPAGRRKMTLQNVSFLDPGVGEEPIRGFRVTPVLAGKRDTSAHAVTQPPQKITKTSTKPSVLDNDPTSTSCWEQWPPIPTGFSL
jgi:hypothetical protein